MCNIFFFENRSVYEIMWKNSVEPVTPQMTIRRVPNACCIPVYRHTVKICITYGFSTTTLVTRTHLSACLEFLHNSRNVLYKQNKVYFLLIHKLIIKTCCLLLLPSHVSINFFRLISVRRTLSLMHVYQYFGQLC